MAGSAVVLGAGVTGLAAAWKLSEAGAEVTVLERNPVLGGLATTFSHGDYRLDLGPHKIYTQLDNVLGELRLLLSDDLLAIPKRSRIWMLGRFYDYPFKPAELLTGVNPLKAAGFGLSYAKAAANTKLTHPPDKTYEQYIVNRFGRGIYEAVFKSYAEKVWGDPQKLDAELARTRISVTSLAGMLKRMVFGDKGKKEQSAKQFYYPRKGIIEMSEKMAEKIEANGGQIILNAEARQVKTKGNHAETVTYSTKAGTSKEINADYVISTIPIGPFVKMLVPSAPANVISAASSLKYRSLVLLYIAFKRERLFDYNWIFFPEKDVPFNRASEQKGFSGSMIPADRTVLCLEMTCEEGDGKWTASDKEIFELAVPALEKRGIAKREEVLEYFTVRLKNVYPVYDLSFKDNLDAIVGFLDSFENVLTNGRQGLFNYNNTDHCIDMGAAAARHVAQRLPKENWLAERKRFDDYLIVD